MTKNTPIDSCLPQRIEPRHYQEWLDSGVHPDIIALNVESLEGEAVYEVLLSKEFEHLGGHSNQYVTQPVKRLLDSYEPLTQGGWWCAGLDPLNNWKSMQWGQFKGDNPRPDTEKPGKFRKYEAIKRSEPGAYYLRVPLHTWRKVSDRYNIPMPTNIVISDRGEALGFWEWVRVSNAPITLAEGAKKAACLLSQGFAAIGCPGVSLVVQKRDRLGNPLLKPLLRPVFQPFATAGREWLICFDHDTKPHVVKDVNQRIGDIYWNLIREYQCQPKIVRLPGPEKGVDDFFVAQGVEALDVVFAGAKSLADDRIAKYTALSFPVSQQINRRYIGELQIPEGEKFICIRSPKGTGKTEWLKSVVNQAQDRIIPFQTFLFTHRIQLGHPICDRIGIPYLSQLGESEEGKLFGYGLCVDSAHPKSGARFDAETLPEDAIVILDEVEQVIKHVLFANTDIRHHRTTVIRQMATLFKKVLNSEHGKIIILDADLCDISIKFIQGLAECPVKPYIVDNEWRPQEEAWRVIDYESPSPDQWLAPLMERITGLEPGKKLFVSTHSQAPDSTWSTHNLEQLWLNHFPEKRVLRIDRETVADPNHPAYGAVSKLNELIEQYDIVLASPTIETGVSIDVRGVFDSVWGCFWGVSDSNAARQALARVRDGVERHVWAAPRGVTQIARGETSLYKILKDEEMLADRAVKMIRHACESFSADEGISYNPTAFNTWGKLACCHNADSKNYRENVFAGLLAEGHSVELAIPRSGTKPLYKELLEIKTVEAAQDGEGVATSEDITDSGYEVLSRKKNKTRAESYQERKHALKQKYQVEVTADLVAKDRKGWHPALRLHYYSTIGNMFLVDREREVLDSATADGEAWFPSLNKSLLTLKVEVLKFLDIPTLITPGRAEQEYRGTDKDIDRIAQLATRYRRELKQILNITISEKDSPIKVVKLILGKLGLDLKVDRREGGRDGPRPRVYGLVGLDDGRGNVFTQWLQADVLKRSQSAVSRPFSLLKEAA